SSRRASSALQFFRQSCQGVEQHPVLHGRSQVTADRQTVLPHEPVERETPGQVVECTAVAFQPEDQGSFAQTGLDTLLTDRPPYLFARLRITQPERQISQHSIAQHQFVFPGELLPRSDRLLIEQGRSRHHLNLSRSRNFCTFPEEDCGRESTIKIRFGTLKPDSFSRQ